MNLFWVQHGSTWYNQHQLTRSYPFCIVLRYTEAKYPWLSGCSWNLGGTSPNATQLLRCRPVDQRSPTSGPPVNARETITMLERSSSPRVVQNLKLHIVMVSLPRETRWLGPKFCTIWTAELPPHIGHLLTTLAQQWSGARELDSLGGSGSIHSQNEKGVLITAWANHEYVDETTIHCHNQLALNHNPVSLVKIQENHLIQYWQLTIVLTCHLKESTGHQASAPWATPSWSWSQLRI